MKVFFTLDSLSNAGTEKSTLDLISNFTPAIQAKVIFFYPGEHLRKAYEKAGISVLFLDASGRMSILRGIRRLRNLINKEKPDIVVSSILRANLISRIACKLTGTTLVGTFVSDSYSVVRTSSFSTRRRVGFNFFYRFDKLTAGIPVAWISNSECIKKSNCNVLDVDPSLVKVIYRGRDSKKFIARNKIPSNGVFRFVYIGRLLQTKGVHELIEAFKLVAKDHANISLDIYGAGPFKGHLATQIKESDVGDKVILHGVVPNGWEKLYEADCFVFPSWYEGFSGSLVEAMMVGIPIIASDIPMNLEAVNLETALIYPVKNIQELASNMSKMIINYSDMTAMGMRARMVACERFNIKRIAGEYQSFLTTVYSRQQKKALMP